MKSKKEKISKIIEDDEFGLLSKRTERTPQKKRNALEQDFAPILDYYNRNGRVPSKTGGLLEKKLAFRLIFTSLPKKYGTASVMSESNVNGSLVNSTILV